MGLTVEIDGRSFRSVKQGLETFEREFNQAFDKSAKPISRELKRSLDKVAEELRRRHSVPWSPGGSPRDRLLKRSGKGMRSIVKSVKVKSSKTLVGVEGRIGAPFPIGVHEKGATIKAKNAKFLTIPLPAALTGSGIPLRKKARDWPDTFVQRSRRGNLLIFQKRGESIVPLYLLRKSVKLPPRLGMETELRKQLGFFEAKMLDILDKALAGV